MYGPLTRLNSCRLWGLARGNEQSASSRAMKPRSGSASRAATSGVTWSSCVKCRVWRRRVGLTVLVGSTVRLRSAGDGILGAFFLLRGATAEPHRAQTFVRVQPLPTSIPRAAKANLRSAGLVKALQASFATLRPFGDTGRPLRLQRQLRPSGPLPASFRTRRNGPHQILLDLVER